MKSRIVSLADYTQAEFPREIDARCPEEYAKRKAQAVTRSGKRSEAVSVLEKGDSAVLALVSELPRFNRSMVPVAVGSSLYDKELEEQLLGHTVGETFTAQVQGTPVTVTVKQATRTVFPELSDELVAGYAASQKGMDSVKTVDDFRHWVEEQYREETRREAVIVGIRACFDYVLTHSEWEFDETEINEIAEEALDIAHGPKNPENTVRQRLEQSYRKRAERDVAISLWVAAIHGVDPAQATHEELNRLDRSFLENYISGQLNLL